MAKNSFVAKVTFDHPIITESVTPWWILVQKTEWIYVSISIYLSIYLSIYCSTYLSFELQLINPSHANPGGREKIKLNFYFHTFLWCFKRFYEGLKCDQMIDTSKDNDFQVSWKNLEDWGYVPGPFQFTNLLQLLNNQVRILFSAPFF